MPENDEIAKEFLRLVKSPDNIPPAKVGQTIDKYLTAMYEDMANRGQLERIERTFLGENIANGYRDPSGRYEFWLRKKIGHGYSGDIDVLIWDLKSGDGKTKPIKTYGNDPTSYPPDDPKGKAHFEKKLAHAESHKLMIKNYHDIDVEIEMDPNKQYSWRNAKSRLMRYNQKALQTGKMARAGKLLGRWAANLAGSGVLGVGEKGVEVLETEMSLYRSRFLIDIAKEVANGNISGAKSRMRVFKEGKYGGDEIKNKFRKLFAFPSAATGDYAFEKLMDYLLDSWVDAAEELAKESKEKEENEEDADDQAVRMRLQEIRAELKAFLASLEKEMESERAEEKMRSLLKQANIPDKDHGWYISTVRGVYYTFANAFYEHILHPFTFNFATSHKTFRQALERTTAELGSKESAVKQIANTIIELMIQHAVKNLEYKNKADEFSKKQSRLINELSNDKIKLKEYNSEILSLTSERESKLGDIMNQKREIQQRFSKQRNQMVDIVIDLSLKSFVL